MKSNYYINQWAKILNESTVDSVLDNNKGMHDSLQENVHDTSTEEYIINNSASFLLTEMRRHLAYYDDAEYVDDDRLKVNVDKYGYTAYIRIKKPEFMQSWYHDGKVNDELLFKASKYSDQCFKSLVDSLKNSVFIRNHHIYVKHGIYYGENDMINVQFELPKDLATTDLKYAEYGPFDYKRPLHKPNLPQESKNDPYVEDEY